ncbi:NYN domain-containing protein [Candidatus Azambacteria bacterium]|nr:NYN domain-containing protein [Candidatus Azambacteria bacterium]
MKYKEQRVLVLIDIQNMYHSAKNLFGARVNFNEILKAAVAGRRLIRAFAYVIKSESEETGKQGDEEKSFFRALERAGLELKIKDLQIFSGGSKKADWDVGIAVDAIRFSNITEAIVLVSGDGDFIPLVEYLKHQGRQVEVIAFDKTTSAKLKEVADDFIDLGSKPGKFLIRINN